MHKIEKYMCHECEHCNYHFGKCSYNSPKCKKYGEIKHPVYESDERGFPSDKLLMKWACIECEFYYFDNDNE